MGDFFRLGHPVDANVKDFFINRIDGLLAAYDLGKPEHKPKVLQQIVEINEERKKLDEASKKQAEMVTGTAGAHIMLQKDGESPRAMTMEEVLAILQTQQIEVAYLMQYSHLLNTKCVSYQKQILELHQLLDEFRKTK